MSAAGNPGGGRRPAAGPGGWTRGAALAGLLFLWAAAAPAEEPERRSEGGGVEVGSFRAGTSAHLEISTRISDQRYASGPSLGTSEKIGDESLLGGGAADDSYSQGLTKAKRKRRNPAGATGESQ